MTTTFSPWTAMPRPTYSAGLAALGDPLSVAPEKSTVMFLPLIVIAGFSRFSEGNE
ncbi:MAG: hypothetical protein H3C58_03830 [Fimbriimonadaceae bacterium]|nr:hypothetical protein [Fimbriimonadaceae bacterium]